MLIRGLGTYLQVIPVHLILVRTFCRGTDNTKKPLSTCRTHHRSSFIFEFPRELQPFVLQDPRKNLIFVLQLNSQPRVNVPCEATFSFTNPLPVALTDCTFSVEAPAIHSVIKFR